MNRRWATLLFLCLCLALAALLLAHRLSSPVAGAIFALGLVSYGLFTRRRS